MEKKTIEELEQEYDFELERIIKEIKQQKPKIVLLQFPDGLKPYATTIANYLEESFPNVKFMIWLGSCFGACDVPNIKEADLIIQFGHSAWQEAGQQSE